MWLATDVEEYYGVMTALLGARVEFAREGDPQPGEPQHDLDYLTNFERKYRIEGRPIYRAHYRLTTSVAHLGAQGRDAGEKSPEDEG